ncbi:MAG: 23S rRNA (guanosine(2251)-2'-O)-methyltransferase RlmB [Treponema sp.]|nr:23S rRNA (guanosine(2251)-2'-O)-methyltransferase RlmB [Treponema sp.]
MIITGFHSIEEKIRAVSTSGGAGAFKLYYSKAGPRVKKILAAADAAGVKANQVEDSKLDLMVSSLDEALRDHRGIVLEVADDAKKPGANIVDFDVWLKTNSSDSCRKLVVLLDRVTDPHNVGAILRSCDQFGAALVVLPEHKAASDIAGNEVIGRSSAGASAWVPVAIVNNLARAAEKLKAAGFWLYGADAGGKSCCEIDFPEKTVLVMGSEGTGIADLLEKQCDQIISIPTCGKIDSLNVSVAAGILLYEVSTRASRQK